MKNNDTEEEKIKITLSKNDSEMVERLKDIIDKSQELKKPNKE